MSVTASAAIAARLSPVSGEASIGSPKTCKLSVEEQRLTEKWQELQLTQRVPPIEDIRFLITSGLAFWIQTFQNSTKSGENEHKLRFINNEYCLKMEERFVPISEIRKTISYNAATEKLVTINNPSEVWSYVSPQGLVKRDRFSYDTLLPIEVIDQEQYGKLYAEAQTFWNTNSQVDVGKPKHCILQVVTTNRTHSHSWATENFAKAYPEHASYRVIMPDGKVYSFGFQMEKAEMDQIFNDKTYPFPLTFTKTSQSQITTPDYEESKPFKQKRITSLTLTQERAENILKFITEQNQEGVRFNFIHQNCATLGCEILKRAGSPSAPRRWTMGEGFASLLPEWEKVPFVGAPLAFVMHTVKSVAKLFFSTLWQVTPQVVQEIVCFLPRKVSSLICNLLVVALGGRLASSGFTPELDTEDELDNRERFTCFSRLVRNIGDWFRDDISDVQPHLTLIEWQMNQQSTRVVDYEGHAKIYF